MNKMWFIILLSALVSCGPDTSLRKEIAGYYRLNLPCEDCRFGVHSVNLKEDGTFEYYNVYVGTDRKDRYRGNWTENEEGYLALSSEEMEEDLILENTGSGLRIFRPHNMRGGGKVDPVFKRAQFAETLESEAQFLNGTDLYAEGYQARWFIAIGLNKFIQIKHPKSGEILNMPYQKPEADYVERTNTWRLEYKGEQMIITHYRRQCEEDKPAHIEFEIGDQSREACVDYLDYRFELHRPWELISFNGASVDPKPLHRGLPVLEIDVINGRGLGHTGCNVWNGGMKLKNTNVIFMPGPMSNAFCEDKGFETEYIKNLGQQLEYRLENGNLILSAGQKELYIYHPFEE